MVIRPIEKWDLPELVEAEQLSNEQAVDDPDFGIINYMNPWTMTEDDIKEFIGRRKDEKQGTWDTRTYAVDIPVESMDDNGLQETIAWTCAGFCFEKLLDGFEMSWVVLHPLSPVTDIVETIANFMKAMADRSDQRKKVVVYVRDRDEAGLRQILPVWKAAGFAIKLVPNYFEGNIDAWKCVYESTTFVEKQDRRKQAS